MHESRLTRGLRTLLHSSRTAALGTIDDSGMPFVSMVPFAIQPQPGYLVIHVSGLAAHTRHLKERPQASLLVMQPEASGQPVHALPRITFQGQATTPEPGSAQWQECRTAYLSRFPEAEPMTDLGDFQFVSIYITSGRHVAGFGTARDVSAQEIDRILKKSPLSRTGMDQPAF